MTKTLFELPPKTVKKRKPYKKTQRSTCRRCKESLWGKDHNEIYCKKFDLCLYVDERGDGEVLLAKNNQQISCDGVKWNY